MLVLGGSRLLAQVQARVCAQDGQGRPMADVTISRGADNSGAGNVATGGDGCALVAVAGSGFARGVLSALAEGFAPVTVGEPQPGVRVVVVLHALNVQQSVTVTADRGLVGVTDEATSTMLVDSRQLAAAPGLALDDRLHQVPGFQLFRRTSSPTANPTTEGVSLRGLGSTAASRTLVESDEVPLNDAFGGWIHWDEIPVLAIRDVVVERGGAADLFGSSAIGGVIALEPVILTPVIPTPGVPTPGVPAAAPVRVAADALGASQDSAQADLLVTASTQGRGDVLLAGSGVDTAGYVPTAPAFRGRVDTPSKVAEESGRLEWRRGLLWGDTGSEAGSRFPVRGMTTRKAKAAAAGDRAWPASTAAAAGSETATPPGRTAKSAERGIGAVFLRGNVLNEARGNGTADQTNGTRLWRYLGGADGSAGWGQAALRVFGDRETYRQSFSAIAADRNSETLTRLQRVPTDEFGFSLTGSRVLRGALTAGAGLDLRDIRATDGESPVSKGVLSSTVSTSAHQRELGGYAEGVWQPSHWTLAGSVRVDSFRTFDGRQVTTTSAEVVKEPEIDERVASPHLGLVRQLRGGVALNANAFRAFRGPTMNELYRTGQVGQQTTMANPRLLAERATGFELGVEFSTLRLGRRGLPRDLGHLRGSYFWTEVNRPIAAVTLSQTGTSQLLQRQNLGQIRSRGLSLEAATARFRGLDASVGYQLAVATVTAFNAGSAVQADLRGNWIPQVPREALVATGNWTRPAWLNLHAIVSYTGQAYDDAANQFVLHPYARVDVSADRPLRLGFSVYAGAQNLLNRSIDAGRTPLLTLAAPRLVQGGLRWQSGR